MGPARSPGAHIRGRPLYGFFGAPQRNADRTKSAGNEADDSSRSDIIFVAMAQTGQSNGNLVTRRYRPTRTRMAKVGPGT